MTRKCEDSWSEAPDCKNIQQEIINPCPPDLHYISNKYCYKIIEKTTFPPKCPYPETVGWDESIQLSLTKDPVWMPVTRDVTEDYGFDVMRFTEFTENYKAPYEICTQSCRTYFYSGSFLDKLCQIYHNATHIETVACDQEYSAFCVYHALPQKITSFCSQAYSANSCKQSGYGTDSPCFCEAINNNQVASSVLAEFILPYQNLIYTNLGKSCNIGLEISKDSPIIPKWSASNQPINYSNWASNVDINFVNTSGVITSDGWSLASDKDEECILYQIPAPTKTGMLQLDIEGNKKDLFKLTIKNYTSFLPNENGEPLVYCFTDADANSLIYRILNFSKIVNKNDYIYKFSDLKIPQSGPGNYWCEAFLYPDLQIIKSETKTLKNYEAEYVVILKLKEYEEKLSSYPLKAENFATLQNLFKNELEKHMSFFPRIFKLNKIDEDKKELTVTFHLSSAEATNTEKIFNALKASSMAQTIFEFVDFRSVDYCPRIQTQQFNGQIIVWPHATLDEEKDPENGFCVTENVTFIQKICLGNFIDGAYWSEITETCTFYANSSLTETLMKITNCTELCDSALNELLDITKNYGSFNTLDLVLTVKFLKTVADQKPNLKTFAEVINNLMKIARPVLLSSQLNFKATDLLLLSLDKALEDGDIDEYRTENFAIKSVNFKNNGIYGIFLQNCLATSTDCDLVPITNTTHLVNESYIATQGVVAAIALSPELYYQINNYSEANSSYIPKLIVSIYYGSQLFIEPNFKKFSNYVFGVLLPGFTKEFTDPLSIYYYSNNNNYLGYNCSYWDFDEPTYSSWADEGTENMNQSVYCEFYHVTNFGIPSVLAGEYCDANQNSEKNSNCFNKQLKVDTLKNTSLVRYQKLCACEPEFNKEYEDDDRLFDETVLCTILIIDSGNKDLSKFCYIGNGTAILTKCFEKFNEGSHRFNIIENCVEYSFSNLLTELHNTADVAKDDCWDSILDILFMYSENYIRFTDLDLLIVAAMMNPIAYSKPDLHKVAGIVSNLMKVSKITLDSAQRSFKAIDILLHNIEETLKDGDCNEWKTENFAIQCLDINMGTIGLIIRNCTNDFNYCSFSPVLFSDNINASHNNLQQIQASILLTETLYEQILTYGSENSSYHPRMIVSLYSGSQLFVELDDSAIKKDVFSFVFGILLPDFNKTFQGPILIHYFNVTSDKLVEYNCSYWKYDSTSYGSWMTEIIKDNKQVAMCEFYHVTNFAIPIKLSNYSHSGNFQHNQLPTLNSKHFYKLNNEKHNVKSIFFYDKDNTCAIRKEQLAKYSLNNFLVTIFGKMDIFGDNYFSFLTREDYLDFLSSIFNSWSNKPFTATSPQGNMFNQRVNDNKGIPFIFSKHFNYGINYCKAFIEKNKDVKYKLEIMKGQLTTIKNLDAIFAKQLLLTHNLNGFNISHNIDIIARVLQKVKLVNNFNSLERLANILTIMMKVPRSTMLGAQRNFQSADKILYSIDNILQEFEATIQIQKENIIFLIISKEHVLNFFGFYVTKNRVIVYLENENKEGSKFNDLEMDIRVIISPKLHDQIKAIKTRMVFVIFYNDIYFPDKENNKVIKPIVEVLFPDLKDSLKADFKIAYNFGDDLNQCSKCSYWDHVVTTNEVVKSGLWKKELSPQFNGTWATCIFNHATHFALITSSQNITTDLEYILNSNLTGLEKLQQVESITYKSHANLLPVDVFLISQILGNSLTEGAAANVTSNIISNLFNVPPKVLRQSQKVHTATDIILHNVDKMADMLNDTFINNDNFSLIVKDLNTGNLTGVLLHNCNESKCIIDQLYDFINISDYSNDEDTSALLIFNQELVAQIKNLTINTKVIISIYYSNVLFNEIDEERNTTKVFGVVFPGLNTSLDGKVSVIYNMKSKINYMHQCAFWYYKVNPEGNVDNATFGKWKNDTSKMRQGQVTVCNFSHVTHFSMLLSNNDEFNNNAILNIITDIGCVLSLLGIIIILLTAMIFKKWRQNTGNKILINFSIAISLKIAMLYISEYAQSTSSGIGCAISGTILHYAILSECAWMLTIAILQFKRFVEVLGGPPKYVLVKALICGWVFPIIPVICVILIDPENYIEGNAGLCYPSNLGLYLGVWLPVIIIVSINCVIFIFIIYNVFHKKTEYIDSANYEILFQWRLALLLFFMLGLTWLFGFLGEIKGDELFTYIFCITASLQGFVLFLFFIVFNKSTRVLYSHSAKLWFYPRGIFKLWQTKS